MGPLPNVPAWSAAVAPVLAAASGVTLLIAHPPVGLWWTALLSPGLLVLALHRDPRRAGRLGALAGAACFGPMLSWIVLPAGYLAWFLLVTTQVLFVAVLAVVVRPWLSSRLLPLVAALAWVGMDAWRSIFPLGGFEWGAIAYAHVDGSWMLPAARVLGGRGLTLLTVLISVAAVEVARSSRAAAKNRGDTPIERALTATNVPVGFLVGGLLLSVMITIEPPPEVGSLDVLSVQGNDIKHWISRGDDPSFTISTQMRDETVAAVGDGPAPDLTVWPEASIDTDPYSVRGARFLPLLEEAAATSRYLLAGMNLDGPEPAEAFYRTQLLVDQDAQVVDRYDKRAVVPFGEYVPLRGLIGWFPPLQQIPRDIIPSGAPHQVVVDGLGVAVLICFETLFGDVARDNILAGDEPAGLLISATTDASFGISGEAAQHLAQSQLRAVETGRWVVHAALSGSSAFVAPDGTTSQDTGLFVRAAIRQDVPVVEGLTPFLVTGDLLGTGTRWLMIAAIGWVLWLRRRREAAAEETAEAVPAARTEA
ncbi:apolipoprotein N-acyltransferase [Nitriliruptor alkaliphilus]|uniref:apolipoprotein N-acyltransferase n=1 Tax=Nitriliruptor alkaliphilus TaxID=427918 RepID=UPI0006991419|nr:apolipoprotein N-acyltransferase [Nitriliruptor alkaliphilus]